MRLNRFYLILIAFISIFLFPASGKAEGEYDAINNNEALRGAFMKEAGYPTTQLFDDDICEILALHNEMSVTTYNLAGSGITSLDGIEIIEKIQVKGLDLSSNPGLFTQSNLEKLTSLNDLRYLNMGDCGITAVPAGWKISSLRELSLSNNQLTALGGITNCTALTVLSVDGNQISDFSNLSKLTKLEKLNIGGGNIKSFAFLKSLGSLDTLQVLNSNFNDGDWQHLSGLSALSTLTIRESHISSIAQLSSYMKGGKFPGLSRINLSFNYIATWAKDKPTTLHSVMLAEDSSKQYKPVLSSEGNVSSKLSLTQKGSLVLGKQLINEGGTVTPVGVAKLEAATPFFGSAVSGSTITLTPYMNGKFSIKAYVSKTADTQKNIYAELPVTVSGGNLKAVMALRAGGKVVNKTVTGLFSGVTTSIAVPGRSECTKLFKSVGIDLSLYDMPNTTSANVQAGKTTTVNFPRMANGVVTVRHLASGNNNILAEEKYTSVKSGSHTYKPRTNIPGYTAQSKAKTATVNYSKREVTVNFYYAYSEAAAKKASSYRDSVARQSGGSYTPSQKYTPKSAQGASVTAASQASETDAFTYLYKGCGHASFEDMGTLAVAVGETHPLGDGAIYTADPRLAVHVTNGVYAKLRGACEVFHVMPCGHVRRYLLRIG